MILEALEHVLTPCPRPWRRMGYLREQIAIDARLRRNRAAWAPHLSASRAFILKAAQACQTRRSVLVLGAGLQHDLPLRELGGLFEQVYLADLVHRPLVRRRACREAEKRLHFVEFDVTGILREVYASRGGLGESGLISLLAGAEAGLPESLPGEPDLVVSANLASQLMLLPLEWLERWSGLAEDAEERVKQAATEAHVRWLSRRSGACILLSDILRREVSPGGKVLSSTPVAGFGCLRAPDETWTWRIAPIPEAGTSRDIEHRVGAWAGVGAT